MIGGDKLHRPYQKMGGLGDGDRGGERKGESTFDPCDINSDIPPPNGCVPSHSGVGCGVRGRLVPLCCG